MIFNYLEENKQHVKDVYDVVNVFVIACVAFYLLFMLVSDVFFLFKWFYLMCQYDLPLTSIFSMSLM